MQRTFESDALATLWPLRLATNHNPRFAPVIQPTLRTGVEAMVVAAQAWLSV